MGYTDSISILTNAEPTHRSAFDSICYPENSFFTDSLFASHPSNFSFGVAGDPVPYTTHGDTLLSSLLLVSFVLLIVSITQSHRFIVRQLKDIFYTPHNDSNISETSIEMRFQIFLVLLLCLELAIYTYKFTMGRAGNVLIIDSNLLLISIFFLFFLGYHLVKAGLYSLVNNVFFDHSRNHQWLKIMMFVSATEGVLFFPATVLMINLDLSFKILLYYLLFILFLVKILTIYKCWNIFFRQNNAFLQLILYFCTLEIVPLLNLTGGILIFIDNLKFTF